jgi:hypothetical protein
MALGKTCETFSVQLNELFRAVDVLQGRARDSESQDSALPGILGEAADDMHGWLADALAAAREAVEASAGPVELDRTRRALVGAKEAYFHVVEASLPLFATERLEEIEAIGPELKGDWPDWAEHVTDALTQCREQFDTLLPALFDCFEELAERATAGSVSVQNTSIGQQVTIPHEELAAESVP